MLKTIIIDDEEHPRELLADTIKHCNLPIQIIAKCSDVESAVIAIKAIYIFRY